MGERDHDADSIRLRRCCHHVYEDLIHVYHDTCPSTPSQENQNRPSRPQQILHDSPPGLSCLPVNELSPSSTSPSGQERSSDPASSSPNTVHESNTARPVLDDKNVSSTSLQVEESKASCTAQIEESHIPSPASIDGSTSSDTAQVKDRASSNLPQIDENKSTNSASTDESRPSAPPLQVQETSSSTPQVCECQITSSASIEDSKSSNPVQGSSSTDTEESQERKSTNARRHCRPRGDEFVSGYVVRDRKPNKHVPVLNTISSKDEELCTKSDSDTCDVIEDIGHVRHMFWPQPGDILVLQNHRSGIPHPGFDGHVELYVDECYFEKTDYTWDWAYDFLEGDILIRFGRFSPNWKWIREDTVQVYLGFRDCFVLVGREVNHELCPLDFKFSDPTLRPIHAIEKDFHPRLGDLIVRKDSARPFNWTLFWWKEASYVSKPFDMLVRAGFVNSDDHIHSFGVAEVYFRSAQNQHWSFQGRDDYTFGGGP